MGMETFWLRDSRALVDVCMGRRPADLVIRDGRWVCVQSGEIIPGTDIAVVAGRIAYVGPDARHCVCSSTVVLEAHGRHLVPGLLDGHMHVESGMLTVTEFVRAVLPRGTTGLFIDPHEIANVLGLRGVRLMVDEAARQPIHVFVQVPSCVPSAPGLETPGAVIGPADVEEALTWPGIIGLGEMMNFPGVIDGNDKVHAEMSATRRAEKIVGGHYASPDLDLPFHAYVAGGAQDDHEGTRLQDAVERIRQGQRVMLRYGSAWHDVAAQAPAVFRLGLDPRHFILCTDDSHSQTLVAEGHMDRVIRHAIAEGIPPMAALQMATLNTAEHFGVSRDIGCIAPGRYADVVLVKDLSDFRADVVLARGVISAQDGQLRTEMPVTTYPEWSTRTMHLRRQARPTDFVLDAGRFGSEATAHIIGVKENQAPTDHLVMKVPVRGGVVDADPARDIAKLAHLDRHHAGDKVQVGLVHGFGLRKKCAIATTVAHDCHNLLVAGTDDGEMARAVNELAACGGGQVVVVEGRVVGKVELPIAGLMSSRPAAEVAQEAAGVLRGFRECGCALNNPNMQLSLLGLVVIPELRLSDKGLVDVKRFAVIPVLE